jgi:hypothetical protein
VPSSYVFTTSLSCAYSHPPQRDERVLVVWSYSLDEIIPTCRDFDDKLIKLVWSRRSALVTFATPSGSPSGSGSNVHLNEKQDDAAPDALGEKAIAAKAKEKEQSSKREKEKSKKGRSCRFGLGYFVSAKEDVEKTADGPSPRPMRLLACIYCGLAAGLSFCEYPSSSSVVAMLIVLQTLSVVVSAFCWSKAPWMDLTLASLSWSPPPCCTASPWYAPLLMPC